MIDYLLFLNSLETTLCTGNENIEFLNLIRLLEILSYVLLKLSKIKDAELVITAPR